MNGNPKSILDRIVIMVSEAEHDIFTKTAILDKVYCKVGMATSQDMIQVISYHQ